MSEAVESSVKGIGVFSTLQAATEFRFFLLSASFVLLIDSTFLILNQPGVLDLASSKELLENSNLILKVILIFVAFSFLTSIILPALYIVFDIFLIETVGKAHTRLTIFLDDTAEKIFGRSGSSIRDELDHVTPFELRVEAHKTKDKYLLDLLGEHEKNQKQERKGTFQFYMYSFYCLAMLCTNYYVGHLGRNTVSIAVTKFFGSSQPVWAGIIILISILCHRFIHTKDRDLIYCPTLYKELKSRENGVFPHRY